MSDERKEQRPLDLDFPGEEKLSRLYREGNKELPPANLDAAILDAARQAIPARPRHVYFFPSRKWLVPLSLAAALWVTLEIVMEQRTEMTSPRLSAPSSSVSQPQSSNVTPQGTGRLTDVTPPSAFAPAPLEEKMLSRHRSATSQAKEALQGRDSERHKLAAGTVRGIAPASPESDIQITKPAPTQMLQSKQATAEEETDMAADTLKEWLAKIRELRRAGKRTEAEASLKAFKQRYPEYPVEKFLQEQPEALHAPKE